jgi:hypothetical protein
MPSLFSRTRTNSTPKLKAGSVPPPSSLSNASNHGLGNALGAVPPLPPYTDEFGLTHLGAVGPMDRAGTPDPRMALAMRKQAEKEAAGTTKSKKKKDKADKGDKGGDRDRDGYGNGSGNANGPDPSRARTLSTHGQAAQGQYEAEPPFTGFLPLRLDPPRTESDPSSDDAPRAREPLPEHGVLAHKRHVVLSLEACATLVHVLAQALSERALATPFVFSSQAIGANSAATRRLIDAFLATLAPGAGGQSSRAMNAWNDEHRFADPHALGHALRWGLARLVRVQAGVPMRGLMDYDIYAQWRDAEAGSYFSYLYHMSCLFDILTFPLSHSQQLPTHPLRIAPPCPRPPRRTHSPHPSRSLGTAHSALAHLRPHPTDFVSPVRPASLWIGPSGIAVRTYLRCISEDDPRSGTRPPRVRAMARHRHRTITCRSGGRRERRLCRTDAHEVEGLDHKLPCHPAVAYARGECGYTTWGTESGSGCTAGTEGS